MDVEFKIYAPEASIIARLMGHAVVPRGMEVVLAPGARLYYMGREPQDSMPGRVEIAYFFVLRLPTEAVLAVATNLLWDLLTSRDTAGLITKIAILTREKEWEVNVRNPEGKREMESAILALQAAPIPKALWLGE